MSGLEDILENERGKVPEEKLMAYLAGALSPEEQHEVELWLAEEGMESDAIEGLKDISPEESNQAVNTLNRHLRHQLAKRKRKRKESIKDNAWVWIAVVLILLLCVIGFVVLQYSLNK